jgi:hypothetical protein
MGVLNDLGTGIVAGVDSKTGYPIDEYGRLLNPKNPSTGELEPDWARPGTELYNLTNPYGFLEFAIGSGDDFVCMDYAIITAMGGRYCVIDATVNSETGAFIDGFGYHVVPIEDAMGVAREIINSAIGWCEGNDVRHTQKGWNQDHNYFLRSLACSLSDPPLDVSQRMLRFGGKKIGAWINTL